MTGTAVVGIAKKKKKVRHTSDNILHIRVILNLDR